MCLVVEEFPPCLVHYGWIKGVRPKFVSLYSSLHLRLRGIGQLF